MTASVIVLAMVFGAMACIALIAAFVNRHRSPSPSARPATAGSDGSVAWIGGASSSSDCGAGDAGGCGGGDGGGGGGD